MTQFKINNSTTKIGKTVKVKLRLKALGVEGACEVTLKWDAAILQFKEMRLVAPQPVSLGTNESNLSGGVVGILLSPVPNPFAKTKGFVDIVELTFDVIAAGKTPVAFYEKGDLSWNCVSHITNGSILKGKFIDGRVTVKAK